MFEEIEVEKTRFELAGDFLAELKREFGRGDNKLAKVAEFKRVKQRSKTIKEFV